MWEEGGGGRDRGDMRESRDSTCIVARFQSYREASMKMFLRISRGNGGDQWGRALSANGSPDR